MAENKTTNVKATPGNAVPGNINAKANGNTESAVAGKTVIEDGVVAKVTGIAVREVPGVFDLGGNIARFAGAVRGAVGNTDHSQGVSVEVGERQVAADITFVALYPYPLQELAENVRAAAAEAITDLVGMEVAEINVTINDVHFPSDDDEENEHNEHKSEEPRVQ